MPVSDRDVITKNGWRRAAEECATRCDAVRDADLLAAARTKLSGILAAEPRPDDRFATDEARSRYEMAVLGPNMEYELLRHRADARCAKYAHALGASLPPACALLPLLDPDAWRV